jgi:hypothetical protein
MAPEDAHFNDRTTQPHVRHAQQLSIAGEPLPRSHCSCNISTAYPTHSHAVDREASPQSLFAQTPLSCSIWSVFKGTLAQDVRSQHHIKLVLPNHRSHRRLELRRIRVIPNELCQAPISRGPNRSGSRSYSADGLPRMLSLRRSIPLHVRR